MWQTLRIHRLSFALATLSGAMLIAAFPKVDQGWLAWIALAPLMVALADADRLTGFKIGLWTGLIHYVGVLYWTVYTMHIYGYLPYWQSVPAMLFLAAYCAFFTGLFTVALIHIGYTPWRLIVAAPAAWSLLEYGRAWLFAGFPWEFLGYSQYRYLWVLQAADLFGVYGISALIALVNALIATILLWAAKRPWRHIEIKPLTALGASALIVISLAALWGYGRARIDHVDRAAAAAEKATVAVAQGNIEQAVKWDPSFQRQTIAKYRKLTRQIAAPGADLIIWPETATPFYLFQDRGPSAAVIDTVKEAGTFFIIGSPYHESSGRSEPYYYNSAYLIAPDGAQIGRYDKVRLVPFGEYVPLKKYLPFIDKMVAQVGDFQTGREGNTLDWRGRGVGLLICYEAIIPELSRAMTHNGARLLVNITNDAWFGYTSAAYQHFSMAVFRAVENRRTLARAANTGISGFVDPVGRIVDPTPLMVEAIRSCQVPLLKTETIYTRWGDAPLAVCVMALLIVLLFTRRHAVQSRL
jgi:apolipoprotein N-acyltransferase